LSSTTGMAQQCFLCAMFPLQLLDVNVRAKPYNKWQIQYYTR